VTFFERGGKEIMNKEKNWDIPTKRSIVCFP